MGFPYAVTLYISEKIYFHTHCNVDEPQKYNVGQTELVIE